MRQENAGFCLCNHSMAPCLHFLSSVLYPDATYLGGVFRDGMGKPGGAKSLHSCFFLLLPWEAAL